MMASTSPLKSASAIKRSQENRDENSSDLMLHGGKASLCEI
jgi:hypothetical protein